MPPNAQQSPQKPTIVKDIILLLSVPIAIGLIALLFVYIPTLFAHPKYGFVYQYCQNYGCNDTYSVTANGKLIKEKLPSDFGLNARLGYYDPTTGSTRALSEDEAKKLYIMNSAKSPDGYILVHSTGDSGLLFFGDYHNNWQLQNGLKRKTIQFYGVDANSYEADITFIGWVKQ